MIPYNAILMQFMVGFLITWSGSAFACFPSIEQTELREFKAASAKLLNSADVRILPSLLDPADVSQSSSLSAWLDRQLCPYETSLSGVARTKLSIISSLETWTREADALYLTLLIAAAPDYLASIEKAVTQFSATLPQESADASKRNVEDALARIAQAKKIVVQTQWSLSDASLRQMFGLTSDGSNQ